MAAPSESLIMRLLIQARDQGASGVLDGLNGAIKRVLASLAAWMGMRALASWLSDAVGQAGALERQLSILRQVTGASADEMARLQGAAEAGARIAGTAAAAAAAEVELAKAGQSASEVLASLPGVLNLAAAEQLSVAQSAGLVTQVLAGFGLQASEAARVTNTLTAGAQASKTSAVNLGQALSYAAPMARAAGMSLETVVAAMGLMANGGIDADRAGTALLSILSQLADPSGTATTALRAMGVVSSDLSVVLARLAQGGPAAERAIIAFGTEAGPGLRSLIAAGAAGIEDLRGKIVANTTASADAAAAVKGGLLGALEQLAATWSSVKAKVGEGLLRPLATEVRGLDAQISAWLQSGQAKQIGEALAVGFAAAAKAVGEWVRSMDLRATLDRVTAFATETGATLDAWSKNLQGVAETTSRVLDGIVVAWDGFRAGIETAAAGVLQALSVITFGKFSDDLKQAAETARAAALQHFGAAGQAALRAAGQTEEAASRSAAAGAQQAQAAHGVATSAEEVARAAGIGADELDRMGAAAEYGTEVLSGQASAAKGAAAAQEQHAATVAETTAAQEAFSAQLRESGVQTLNLDTKTGRLTQSTGASAAATRSDADAKAEAARRLKEQAAALAILIDQQRLAADASGRAVGLIEAESQARIQHIQNMIAEAKARGDLEAVQFEEEALQSASVDGARRVYEARKAEASAAATLAESLAKQAQAQQDTSAATLGAVAAAKDDAKAKKIQADAADEALRHQEALRDATEQTTAAQTAQTAATVAGASAQQSAASSSGGRSGGGAGTSGSGQTDAYGHQVYTDEQGVVRRVTRSEAAIGITRATGQLMASTRGIGAASTPPVEGAAVVINLRIDRQDPLRLAAAAIGGRASV